MHIHRCAFSITEMNPPMPKPKPNVLLSAHILDTHLGLPQMDSLLIQKKKDSLMPKPNDSNCIYINII